MSNYAATRHNRTQSRPKPGRPAVDGAARSAILAAADALFYANGVTATTMGEIAGHAGVTRRTLYYHFASKETLVGLYLERRDASSRKLVFAENAPGAEPVDRICRVFDELDKWINTRHFGGCALTNATAEKGETVVIAGTITARHKRAIRDWFIAQAEGAGLSDPRDLAEELMLLFDGTLTSAITRKDKSVARHAARAARMLVNARS